MNEPLRSRQAKLARETILESLAAQVVETGSLDFSVAEVAERAGVALRTVYNYFDDRQGLIDAFVEYVDAEMAKAGGTNIPDDIAELPGLIAQNYRSMEASGGLSEALARLDHVRATYTKHAEMTSRVARSVSRRYPHISEREAAAVAAAIRQLVGTQPWYRLTREFGLTTDEASQVVAWSLQAMMRVLDAGDRPLEEGGAESGRRGRK